MFSEKYKYKPEQSIQLEPMSECLKQRIWNLFYINEIQSGGIGSTRLSHSINGTPLIEDLILDKLGLDETQKNNSERLKRQILTVFQWYQIYDFVEIHISLLNDEKRATRVDQYNALLEAEKAGYRIVDGEIVPITDKDELKCIERTISSPYESVRVHMKKALDLYSDREKPDYENSIKESISAVEAMCCTITGLNGAGATLGTAIKKIRDNGLHIHKAMESAFSSLYGYTSDENGIRHGRIDFTNAPAEDARFMLVSCSAFVNYLIEKWSKIK